MGIPYKFSMKFPYQINFLPNCKSPSGAGFSFSVDLREDFIESAKRQQIDHKAYEEDGKRILLGAGYNTECVDKLVNNWIGIYGWHQDYSGLMVRASVPGWQENQIDLINPTPREYRLTAHNIDDSQQFAASFALVNKWLNDIMFRM
jgi:hypothetical protein